MDGVLCQRLLGRTISDVITISDQKGDQLTLVFPDGSAIEIKAERLDLSYVADFEGELAAIEIIQVES